MANTFKNLNLVFATPIPVYEIEDYERLNAEIIKEVHARRGPVIALTNPPKPGMELNAGHLWIIPEAWGPLNSFLLLPALQLFSYEAATYLGKDVDQPRNLAKSVTVE